MTPIQPATPDYYSMCENAVLNKVKQLPYFSNPYQVGKDETAISQKGEYFFIAARPGEFPMKPLGQKRYDVSWHVECDIYCLFKKFKTSPDSFRVFRSDIINFLMADPNLDGTMNVFHVLVQARDKAGFFKFDEESENPDFIMQTLDVVIDQRISYL